MEVQWLFVDGPLAGQTVWTDDFRTYLEVVSDAGQSLVYRSHDWVLGPDVFRLGSLDASLLQAEAVAGQIRSAEPVPFRSRASA